MAAKEFDISGRTAIVTGAARGIGKGIARVLSEAGAKVMVTALTDRYLGPLSEERAAAGHPIETLVADATSGKEWERTLEYALDRWEHIDVLINNLDSLVTRPV